MLHRISEGLLIVFAHCKAKGRGADNAYIVAEACGHDSKGVAVRLHDEADRLTTHGAEQVVSDPADSTANDDAVRIEGMHNIH